MKNSIQKNKLKGFSLIEVMLSVLILGVGILAVSKLQTSLLQSGSNANNRSIAASIANQKIDDLRRFAYQNVANTWSANLTTPTSVSFNHIASNEGGLIAPGTVTVGNQDYSLNWTVSNYVFDGAGNPATITSPASARMKAVHVVVAWDSVGDTTNNIVSFDTFVYGYEARLTSLTGTPDSTGGGDINLKTGAADSEIFEIDPNLSFGSELIAPDVSKKGNSTLTKTVFSIFNSSDRVLQSSDEYRTVACLCKNGSTPNTTSQVYSVTSWDPINKRRTDVLETRTNTITKTDVDAGGGDQPALECETCCENGHGDDGLGNPNYDAANKICRLKLVGGKLYMTDPWKALAFNIIPNSYFTDGIITTNLTAVTTTQERAHRTLYSNYLTSLIRTTLLSYTTSAFYNALTTVDSTFPTVASDYLVGTTSHLEFINGDDRQFQSRIIYLDFPAQGSYEGSTYTATNIPLERIPFAEFNVANLAVWTPDVNLNFDGATSTGDTSIPSGDYTGNHDELNNSCNTDNVTGRTFVTNEELNNSCEDDYSRGFVNANSGDDENIKAGIYTGNNGLVNRYINKETTAISSVDITAP